MLRQRFLFLSILILASSIFLISDYIGFGKDMIKNLKENSFESSFVNNITLISSTIAKTFSAIGDSNFTATSSPSYSPTETPRFFENKTLVFTTTPTINPSENPSTPPSENPTFVFYDEENINSAICNGTSIINNSIVNSEGRKVQLVHRKCNEFLDCSQIDGSKRLLHMRDQDRSDAWWIIDCLPWENWAEIVRRSLHRRIKKWLSRKNNNNSLSVKDSLISKNYENNSMIFTNSISMIVDKMNITGGSEQNHTLVNEILGDWRIFLIDYKDIPDLSLMKAKVRNISDIVGWQRVYFITRTTGQRRNRMRAMNPLGRNVNWFDMVGSACVGVKKFHFPVRDDLAEAIEGELEQMRNNTSGGPQKQVIGSNSSNCPVYLSRPIDAAHWWDPNITRKARFRSSVSKALLDIKHKYAGDRNLSIVADIVGHRGHAGRTGVHEEYVRALLQTKIIVVAQRDRWEDHYRLFEALISGALVMSDGMLRFPWGIEDGSTIVVYKSLQDLEEKILYYLDNPEERRKIAKAGCELSLNHHRKYNRMEDLLFGNWSARDRFGVSFSGP